MTGTRSLVAVALVVTLVSGAFAGTAAAATNGTITANPSSPGETAQHIVTVTVGSATASSSWNGLKVDYEGTGAEVSNVSVEDVEKIGIDRNADNAGDRIDVNVSDDLSGVSVSNNGHTLKFTLGGSYTLHEGDELVVVYDDVVNPVDTGVYTVSLDVNPQSSGGEAVAELDIEPANQQTTTQQTTTQQTTTQTTQSGGETTATTDKKQQEGTTVQQTTTAAEETETTSGGSPGFGLGVALVAIAGTAFLATRD